MWHQLNESFGRSYCYFALQVGARPVLTVRRVKSYAELKPRYIHDMEVSMKNMPVIDANGHVSESTLPYVINRIGADKLLYASDYPHWDSK